MPATPHDVDDLVPHPFTLEQFRLAVERRTGRPLARAAHLLLGHQPRERPALLVHLNLATVAETVTFHGYSYTDEREAEDFAHLLVSTASNAPTVTKFPSPGQPDSE